MIVVKKLFCVDVVTVVEILISGVSARFNHGNQPKVVLGMDR